MKNRINVFALISILSILSISCQKEIKFDFDAEKQLVINALVNDQEPISVEISESFDPGLDRKSELEIIEFPSAKVDIYENDVFRETLTYAKLQDDAIGQFRSSFIPDPQNFYSITVVEDHYGELSSHTSIPGGVAPTNGFMEKIVVNADIQTKYFFSFEIEDPPAEENYYFFSLTYPFRMVDEITGDTITNNDWQFWYLKVNDESNKLLYRNSGYVFSDEQFNGLTYTVSGIATVDIPYELEVDEIWYEIDTTTAFIHLYELSIEAYNFYSTHARYLINKEQPFSDPVTIYGNIENGLGFFGGASIKKENILVQ